MVYNPYMELSLSNLLQKHPVFFGLKAAKLDRLVGTAILKRYWVDEYLSRAGDLWPYLFLVAEGSIKAVKESSEGRSLVVTELGAGELFWGLAFFQDALPNPVSLQVNRPAVVYLWQRNTILPFLMENGQLTWELSRLMVSRMLHASEVIEGLAFQPVAGRLARLLLNQYPAERQSAERHLTLDEMAARVGTTREMVCRILYKFAEDGAIRISRTEFEFLDRRILDDLARR